MLMVELLLLLLHLLSLLVSHCAGLQEQIQHAARVWVLKCATKGICRASKSCCYLPKHCDWVGIVAVLVSTL
jgi:hypothetical protein